MASTFLRVAAPDRPIWFRILPGQACLLPWSRRRVHYVGGKPYYCPAEYRAETKKYEGDCRLCDHWREQWNLLADPADPPKELRTLKPVERFFFNVVDRDDEARGVIPWSCGPGIFKKLEETFATNPWVALFDVETGRDLTVHSRQVPLPSSNGVLFPVYTPTFSESRPLGTPEQIELWMSQRRDLSTLGVPATPEQLAQAMDELVDPAVKSKKVVHRAIDAAWVPSW